MARTEVKSHQIKDGQVKRPDLNTTETGEAVVRKVVAGTNVTLSSTGVDSGTGDVTVNVDLSSITVSSADKLTTARTISATGDASWSVTFDGSANVSSSLTLANSGATVGTYPKVTVDAKGRVTSGSSLSASDIPSLDASKITSGQLPILNGGTGASTESGARTNLGATTVGSNIFTLTNPSAIRFIRLNADNTVSALSDSDFRTAIGAGTGVGSVTSVGLSLPSIFNISNSPVTSSGTLTGSLATQTANVIFAGPTTGVDAAPTFRSLVAGDIPSLDASKITSGQLPILNGGTGASTDSGARTNLGATTVGSNLFTLTNPSAITFLRLNADNTVSALDAATFRTAIGAGTGGGSVTSVGLSLPGIFTVSNSPVTSSGTLTGALATQNANIVFAGPTTGVAAAPTFRSLVAGDIPSLDASKITSGQLGIANGGTGQSTAQTAINALTQVSAATNEHVLTKDTSTGNAIWKVAPVTAAITSLNALTGATQTFATGTSGTDFAISSAGTTHTFNIPSASASARGVVTTSAQTFAGIKTFSNGLDAGSSLITNVATPVSANDAATKSYVDAITFPMDVKNSCRVATTVNITIATALNSGDVIDGVTLADGDRVLVKNQNTASENGIYVVGATPARSNDANVSSEVTANMFVFVSEGSSQADTQWVLTTNDTITLGSTALTFAQFGAAPGTGLNTLNTLSTTSQTFATGTSGTDFAISSSGSTHTFNIPDASATARGVVTTGAQTLAGAKTFSSAPVLSSLTASLPLKLDASKNITSAAISIASGSTEITGTLPLTSGGTGATTNSGARTNLGATTVGSNLFTLTNPSAITFLRVNADNTVSSLNAADFRTAIGAGTGSGSVTSVGLSLPAIFTVSNSPVTSSGTLTGALATQNANIVFAGPTTGVAAAPTFRSLVAGDIPSLDASKITTGQIAIANGGTGASTAQTAINALTQVSSATNEYVLTKDTSTGNAVWKSIPAGSIPDASTTVSGLVNITTQTFGGVKTFNDGLTSNGNLTFTGTSRRILADFSNATIASRTLFQSSTTNGNTGVYVVPNGTSSTSAIITTGGSDTANANTFNFGNIGAEATIRASKTGTASFGPITFYTSDIERLRINANGAVGIGCTAAADAEFQVGGGHAFFDEAYYITFAGSGSNARRAFIRTATHGTEKGLIFGNFLTSNSTDTDRMTIRGDTGYVGVGVTSPVTPLHIHTTSGNTTLHLTNATTGTTISDGFSLVSEITSNDAFIVQRENANLIFRTDNTERLRITNSGNVGIGNTDPGFLLDCRSEVRLGNHRIRTDALELNERGTGDRNTYIDFHCSGNPNDLDFSARILRAPGVNGAMSIFSSGTGGISVTANTLGVNLAANGTTWASLSDERQKHIIEPIINGIEKVKTLRSVIGRYLIDPEETRRAFLIAQDVQAVLPEAISVSGDEEGTLYLQGVDVIPLLVSAIKELATKNEQLEQTLQLLITRVAALESAE